MTDGDMAAAQGRREAAGFPDAPEFEIETIQLFSGAFRPPTSVKVDAWECPGCGGLVLDPDRHIEFHDRIGDPL